MNNLPTLIVIVAAVFIMGYIMGIQSERSHERKRQANEWRQDCYNKGADAEILSGGVKACVYPDGTWKEWAK